MPGVLKWAHQLGKNEKVLWAVPPGRLLGWLHRKSSGPDPIQLLLQIVHAAAARVKMILCSYDTLLEFLGTRYPLLHISKALTFWVDEICALLSNDRAFKLSVPILGSLLASTSLFKRSKLHMHMKCCYLPPSYVLSSKEAGCSSLWTTSSPHVLFCLVTGFPVPLLIWSYCACNVGGCRFSDTGDWLC